MASGTDLSGHLAALRSNDSFTDVVLVACAEDGNLMDFPSHLNILARSPVFERMFSGAFAESALKRVEIPVARVEYVELLRDYLYTDKMEFPDDWTASDAVELLALVDKYDVTSANSLVSKELMKQVGKLELSDAKQILERMTCRFGQQVRIVQQEALVQVATKVKSGREAMDFLIYLQDFQLRSGISVTGALAKIVSKMQFGSQVMQCLVWLQRFHRSTGIPVQTERDALMEKIEINKNALERELAVRHGDADAADVMRARMLMTTKFLERVTQSMSSSVHSSCPRCFLRLSSTTCLDLDQPMLSFGVGRLMEDMHIAFTGQPPMAGVSSDCANVKRQKTS